MDKLIGLRQKAFVTDIKLGQTANKFPCITCTITYGDKSKKRGFYSWKDMNEKQKSRLKENLLQLLEAYRVNNAEKIIHAKYTSGEAFFQAVIDALPDNYDITPVDFLLVYEEEISKPYKNDAGQTVVPDRCWPRIAEGASGVSAKSNKPWRLLWISPAQKGTFTPQEEGDVIWRNEKGEEHPIQRWASWRTSNEAIPQGNVGGKPQQDVPQAEPELAF
jgi:hypothetical protein